MTTREFINKAWYGTTRSKQCSSVFIDNGNLYSYGYHYPLLFTVGDKVIRNVRGYSNSTSKHIGWTRDIDAIDIEVPSSFRLGWDTDNARLAVLESAQKNYIRGIQAQMDAKKRKDTSVYRWLQYQYDRATANLKELQA